MSNALSKEGLVPHLRSKFAVPTMAMGPIECPLVLARDLVLVPRHPSQNDHGQIRRFDRAPRQHDDHARRDLEQPTSQISWIADAMLQELGDKWNPIQTEGSQ